MRRNKRIFVNLDRFRDSKRDVEVTAGVHLFVIFRSANISKQPLLFTLH